MNLEGFSKEEATNFVRSTEVQFTAADRFQLAGFRAPEGVDSARVSEALAQHYDFQRAKIVEATPEILTGRDGETLHALNVKVEIPSLQASKPSLFLRIKFFLTERVTGPMMEAVQNAVAAIFTRAQVRGSSLVSRGVSRERVAADILSGVKRDLEKISIEGVGKLPFEIEVSADFGDFLVAENCAHGNAYPG